MTADTTLDAIIIGGGPAGMSAAVWCADLGLKAALFDRAPQLGGQLLWTHNPIQNYLGFPSIGATDLARRFEGQVRESAIKVVTGQEISGVDVGSRTVITEESTWTASAMILATGVRRR